MRSECFNCGSRDHYAKDCTAPPHGCKYRCECGRYILVTSRGQTPHGAAAASSSPSSSSAQTSRQSRNAAPKPHATAPTAAPAPPPQPAKGRLASVALSSTSAEAVKRRKVNDGPGGKELRVLNTPYTSLSWFLCAGNPTPKQVNVARAQCSEHAMEIRGCHTRALDARGFAAVPPNRPKSLTGDRVRLSRSQGPCDVFDPWVRWERGRVGI